MMAGLPRIRSRPSSAFGGMFAGIAADPGRPAAQAIMSHVRI